MLHQAHEGYEVQPDQRSIEALIVSGKPTKARHPGQAEHHTKVVCYRLKATGPRPESGLLIDCVPRWEVGGIILQVAPARTIHRRLP